MGQVVELVNVFILAQIVIKAENVAVKGDMVLQFGIFRFSSFFVDFIAA